METQETEETEETKYMGPAKSIRKYCLGCSGGSPAEVRNCVITDCELYPYRFGKNPFSKRKGNPEAIQALQDYREAKKLKN